MGRVHLSRSERPLRDGVGGEEGLDAQLGDGDVERGAEGGEGAEEAEGLVAGHGAQE